jgi:hypothetical protein
MRSMIINEVLTIHYAMWVVINSNSLTGWKELLRDAGIRDSLGHR